MPRDIKDKMLRTAARKDFIEEQKNKAKKPLKKKIDISKKGTLRGIRNVRLMIRDAAIQKLQIVIVYKKTTTNEIKTYTVCPYSYRYKRLKVGTRKMLFAYDMKDKHIKNFALTNIKSITDTNKKFSPKWKIEIN